MKRIVETDNAESGLEACMGSEVLLLCGNYFYHGEIIALSDTEVCLTNAGIVYETGAWHEEGFMDRQSLPGIVYIKQQAIEAYVPM